jgi:hypothetical protein
VETKSLILVNKGQSLRSEITSAALPSLALAQSSLAFALHLFDKQEVPLSVD